MGLGTKLSCDPGKDADMTGREASRVQALCEARIDLRPFSLCKELVLTGSRQHRNSLESWLQKSTKMLLVSNNSYIYFFSNRKGQMTLFIKRRLSRGRKNHYLDFFAMKTAIIFLCVILLSRRRTETFSRTGSWRRVPTIKDFILKSLEDNSTVIILSGQPV